MSEILIPGLCGLNFMAQFSFLRLVLLRKQATDTWTPRCLGIRETDILHVLLFEVLLSVCNTSRTDNSTNYSSGNHKSIQMSNQKKLAPFFYTKLVFSFCKYIFYIFQIFSFPNQRLTIIKLFEFQPHSIFKNPEILTNSEHMWGELRMNSLNKQFPFKST